MTPHDVLLMCGEAGLAAIWQRSTRLVRSLLLQSVFINNGKPELTPQMLRARAIMKTFPAGTYPGDRADMLNTLRPLMCLQ